MPRNRRAEASAFRRWGKAVSANGSGVVNHGYYACGLADISADVTTARTLRPREGGRRRRAI